MKAFTSKTAAAFTAGIFLAIASPAAPASAEHDLPVFIDPAPYSHFTYNMDTIENWMMSNPDYVAPPTKWVEARLVYMEGEAQYYYTDNRTGWCLLRAPVQDGEISGEVRWVARNKEGLPKAGGEQELKEKNNVCAKVLTNVKKKRVADPAPAVIQPDAHEISQLQRQSILSTAPLIESYARENGKYPPGKWIKNNGAYFDAKDGGFIYSYISDEKEYCLRSEPDETIWTGSGFGNQVVFATPEQIAETETFCGKTFDADTDADTDPDTEASEVVDTSSNEYKAGAALGRLVGSIVLLVLIGKAAVVVVRSISNRA